MQLSLDEEIIWICGSTGPGEEEIILRIFRRLLARFARLRLVIVPRHPERFDEVARLIEEHKFQCLRTGGVGRERVDFFAVIPPVVLVDQMGVLREYYAIANVVFVGRSLVDLGHRQHGSDMIEPAALVKPVIVGPYTANFAEAVRKFRQADAMMVVDDEEGLEQAVGVLLSTPKEASAMALRASEVVKRERGATARHASAILQVLAAKRGEEISTRPVNPIVTHARPVHPEGTVAPPTPPPPMQTERMPLPALDQPAPPIKKSTSVVITRLGPVPPAPPGESR
jgi:3-deoxy-D-manno-octulosonic-acid transferase